MSDAETGDFSARVDLAALRGYWHAVGDRTEAVADALRPEQLDEVPGEGAVRAALVAAEAMGEDVALWGTMLRGEPVLIGNVQWVPERPEGLRSKASPR